MDSLRDNSRVVNLTEKARNTSLAGISMWVTGSMTRWQAKAFIPGLMAADTRDNSRIVNLTEKAKSVMPMDKYKKECGQMITLLVSHRPYPIPRALYIYQPSQTAFILLK